jgi:hypothetical protein
MDRFLYRLARRTANKAISICPMDEVYKTRFKGRKYSESSDEPPTSIIISIYVQTACSRTTTPKTNLAWHGVALSAYCRPCNVDCSLLGRPVAVSISSITPGNCHADREGDAMPIRNTILA